MTQLETAAEEALRFQINLFRGAVDPKDPLVRMQATQAPSALGNWARAKQTENARIATMTQLAAVVAQQEGAPVLAVLEGALPSHARRIRESIEASRPALPEPATE